MAKRKKSLTYKAKGSTHSHKTKKRLAIKEEMLAKKRAKGEVSRVKAWSADPITDMSSQKARPSEKDMQSCRHPLPNGARDKNPPLGGFCRSGSEWRK